MTDLYFDKNELRTKSTPYTRKNNKALSTEFRNSQRIGYDSGFRVNDGYREGTTLLKGYPNKPLMKKSERTPHPTQKPVDLCKVICKAYCKEGGTILDPFAGSGTIPLATAQTNRKAIGIEKEPKYYSLAKARLEQEAQIPDDVKRIREARQTIL